MLSGNCGCALGFAEIKAMFDLAPSPLSSGAQHLKILSIWRVMTFSFFEEKPKVRNRRFATEIAHDHGTVSKGAKD